MSDEELGRAFTRLPGWRWAEGMMVAEAHCGTCFRLNSADHLERWNTVVRILFPDAYPDVTDRCTELLLADWARGLWIEIGAGLVAVTELDSGQCLISVHGRSSSAPLLWALRGEAPPTLSHAAYEAAKAAGEVTP